MSSREVGPEADTDNAGTLVPELTLEAVSLPRSTMFALELLDLALLYRSAKSKIVCSERATWSSIWCSLISGRKVVDCTLAMRSSDDVGRVLPEVRCDLAPYCFDRCSQGAVL